MRWGQVLQPKVAAFGLLGVCAGTGYGACPVADVPDILALIQGASLREQIVRVGRIQPVVNRIKRAANDQHGTHQRAANPEGQFSLRKAEHRAAY